MCCLRFIRLTIIVASPLAILESSVATADGPAKVFRAGAYEADITPTTFPVSSNGSMRDRTATAAHDRLLARCLVLDDGVSQVAIAICDSCMIPRHILDRAKQRAATKTGIPVENMLVAATHTHTGVTVTGVFQSEPEEDYITFLVDKIATGIEQAWKERVPAKIGWATAEDPTQVFNRRWFMQRGFEYVDPFGRGTDRVRMNPPRGHAALKEPSGPIDPQICLVSVQTLDGVPISVLANYSLHYVGGVPSHLLSSDYFGEFARRFTQRIDAESVVPSFVAMMSNGTSGNINNVNFSVTGSRRAPFEQIRAVALSVTDAAYEGYASIRYQPWVPLKMREAEIELAVRSPTPAEVASAKATLAAAGPGPYSDRNRIYARETILLSGYPASVRVKLQAIRIGDLGIVSSPCETFVETGLAIKQQSPFDTTFTIELANGYNGYLPTPEHHELGGYETWRARSSYLAEEAEPRVRETLLELLKGLQEGLQGPK